MYYKKTKDWRKQQMSEYRIIYISDEDGGEVEGCGYGYDGYDAVRNFLEFACGILKILRVRFIRRVD